MAFRRTQRVYQPPGKQTPFVNTTQILGVEVSCLGRRALLKQVIAWARDRKRRTITYVNAHCFNIAAEDADYHTLLNQTNLVYSDGISIVWASKLLGGCPLEKITGRDWIYDFCELASRAQLRIYILAGEKGVAQTARKNLMQQYPNLQIVGADHGYLDDDNTGDVIDRVNTLAPDILFVGMGSPRQEAWIADHCAALEVSVFWSVGALFDCVAGQEPPVPTWLENLALEWLWRLLVDPLGKWRRYLVGNPLFLYRLLRSIVFSADN